MSSQQDIATIARLTEKDKETLTSYLIDNGAEVSVVPPNHSSKNSVQPTSMKLYAVNGTPIDVYGETNHTLNLGLRRPYTWSFIVANVKTPIIRADFLRHHDLLVDLKRNRLIDANTQIATRSLCAITSHEPSPQTIDKNSPFADLIQTSPDLLRQALQQILKLNIS